MIALLLAAAVVTALTGDLSDTVVIAIVVALNTCVGVVQEVRAERAVTALQSMSAPQASVLRDGVQETVATTDVVPGDVLLLQSGDVVGADGDVQDSHQLQADEAPLTGESNAIC